MSFFCQSRRFCGCKSLTRTAFNHLTFIYRRFRPRRRAVIRQMFGPRGPDRHLSFSLTGGDVAVRAEIGFNKLLRRVDLIDIVR